MFLLRGIFFFGMYFKEMNNLISVVGEGERMSKSGYGTENGDRVRYSGVHGITA